MSERICEYRECDASLQGRRSQCRYCIPAHRTAESRLRRAEAAGSPPAGKKPHRNRTSASRRASRDGLGTRVYLTFGELVHLERIHGRAELPGTPAGDQLLAKFAAAHNRIQAKELGGPRGSIRRGAA